MVLKIAYEYFLNNFYVAVTRAKNKIIIIDSEDAKKEFWDNIAIDLLYKKYKELNPDIEKDNLLSYQDGKAEDLELNETDKLNQIKDKLQTDIFERYDNVKDKTILLNYLEKILKKQKLNKVYHSIIEGLKAENNENYIKAIKHLMKAVIKATDNKELSKSQISYLTRKAFENLIKSVSLEDEKTLKFLNEYEGNFKTLGLKYEKRVKLLKYFLNRKYSDTLTYLKDEFDIRDKNDIFDYIIMNSLNNIENYELSDYIVDLYNKKFIDTKNIVQIIKNRLNNKSDYKYLIKIFDIDDIKKQYKDIYCQINLELNSKDIDCLIYTNKLDRVVELIDSNEVENFEEYYKQILYYLSKNPNNQILEKLDINLIIDTYLKSYKELSLDIWRYVLIKTIENIEDNDNISKLMKFFEDKTKETQRKHLEVLIDILKQQEKPLLNTIVFNTLVTLFSGLLYKINIYEAAFALEKTFSFYKEDNIIKILRFYKFYLEKTREKYKAFVASRFIKIKYELDENDKNRFKDNFDGEYSKFNEEWLNFVKRRVKFLKVEATTEIISKIPLRIDYELAKKTYKLKRVDDIYKKIIDSYDVEELSEETIKEVLQEAEKELKKESKVELANKIETPQVENSIEPIKEETIIVNKDNILDILDSIQDFIYEYKEWDRRFIKQISNTLTGIKEDVDKIREKVNKE